MKKKTWQILCHELGSWFMQVSNLVGGIGVGAAYVGSPIIDRASIAAGLIGTAALFVTGLLFRLLEGGFNDDSQTL